MACFSVIRSAKGVSDAVDPGNFFVSQDFGIRNQPRQQRQDVEDGVRKDDYRLCTYERL